MKIKKQLMKLYTMSFVGSFGFTDGIWVLLMAARGFTLAEIGIAEGVFHAVSLICEVPSGMMADIYGRRRTLIFSYLTFAISCLTMVASDSFILICIAMGLNALGYNLSSGTTESMIYDSLLEVGREKTYIKVSSSFYAISDVTAAVCKLLSGFALRLGYMLCYGMGIFTALGAAAIASRLREATPPGRNDETKMKFRLSDVPKNIAGKAKESVMFIKGCPISLLYMLASAAISASAVMTSFLIQEHFVENGADGKLVLGILLFIIAMGSAVGAKLAPLAAKLPHKLAAPISGILCAAGLCICSVPNPYLAALGGFISLVADSSFATITDMRLNDMFPSSDRATLVSVNSMSFSLVMVVLSPLYGCLCDMFGTSNSFFLCGIVLAAFTLLGTVFLALKTLMRKSRA
jgi:MFS family permease